jgi:hypothetical protein
MSEQLSLGLQVTTRGPILFVAYRDGADMPPVATDTGTLATYPDLDEARRAAGALGVGAPVTLARAREVARRHGLSLEVAL